MITREEAQALLTEIGTIEDAAERRAKLTTLTDGVNGLFDENKTLSEAKTKFEADNKKLQEYNMQLFLRVGGQTTPKEDEHKPSESKLTYENLFNEKGELK